MAPAPRSRFLLVLAALVLPVSACTRDRPPADDPLWDPLSWPTFHLTIPDSDWEARLTELMPPHEDECSDRPYLRASLVFDNPQTGASESHPSIGVRWRGRSALDGVGPGSDSRAGLKLSFDEEDPEGRLHGARKINLLGTEGDFSQMREFLALTVSRDAGLVAPRSNYAELYVNDAYLGLYPLTEEPDDQAFLDAHFADPDGPLFKVNGYCGGTTEFEWEGDDPEAYVTIYEPKAGTGLEELEAHLLPLLRCTEEMDGVDFEDCIEDHIDVDRFLLQLAVDAALPDPDGLAAGGKNFLLYRDPSIERFVVHAWDKDLSFDIDDLEPGSDIFDLRPEGSSYDSELTGPLIREWADAYCEQVLDVAELVDPDRLVPFIDARRELLAPTVGDDPFQDVASWSGNVDDVQDVIRAWHPRVVGWASACDP